MDDSVDYAALPPLVLVFVGESPIQFPAFIGDTIRQALRWNPRLHIHVVASHSFVASEAGKSLFLLSGASTFTESDAYWRRHVNVTELEALPVSGRLAAFRNQTAPTMDGEWRGGFWRFAAERLFVLEAALSYLRVDEAFHMEYDNVMFASFEGLMPALRRLYAGMAATALSAETSTAGFLYIHRAAALARFLDFIIERKLTGNEMIMLNTFSGHFPQDLGMLPVAPARVSDGGANPRIAGSAGAFDALGGYFDNAAHGQWLGGAHDIHSNGVVVPHHVNAIAQFSVLKLAYRWAHDAATRLRRPYISLLEAGDGAAAPAWSPLYTAHVHSKEVYTFAS